MQYHNVPYCTISSIQYNNITINTTTTTTTTTTYIAPTQTSTTYFVPNYIAPIPTSTTSITLTYYNSNPILKPTSNTYIVTNIHLLI